MATGERLRLLFCDHLSLARGKYLPASKIGDGASRFCQGTYAVTYCKDLIPAPGGKMLEGLPDMDAVYKAADIRAGWEPNTKVVVGDLFESNGTPLGLCGRTQLKRTVSEWQALGYTPKVGLELEAYAFQHNAEGKLVPYDTPGAYVYSTGKFADPIRFTDAIWQKASEAGFKIDCFTSEYDSPQFEFTLTYTDAVKAVDDIFLFRLLAREVALDHGIVPAIGAIGASITAASPRGFPRKAAPSRASSTAWAMPAPIPIPWLPLCCRRRNWVSPVIIPCLRLKPAIASAITTRRNVRRMTWGPLSKPSRPTRGWLRPLAKPWSRTISL